MIELPALGKVPRHLRLQIYPSCPKCATAERVYRAGLHRGIQRYKCHECGRRFAGRKIQTRRALTLRGRTFDLLCYHCGSTRSVSYGKGPNGTGRIGGCSDCGRRFVQGGSEDLRKYHLLLERRVADERLPADVSAEVLQQAYVDVLSGHGYCWSVDLDVKGAIKAINGEYQPASRSAPFS